MIRVDALPTNFTEGAYVGVVSSFADANFSAFDVSEGYAFGYDLVGALQRCLVCVFACDVMPTLFLGEAAAVAAAAAVVLFICFSGVSLACVRLCDTVDVEEVSVCF